MAATIPYPAPAGYRWEAYVPALDGGWRVSSAVDRYRACRADAGYHKRACGATPTVIEIKRGGAGWWAYCAEHAYGAWVEDGKIWRWRLVELEAAR